MKQTFAILVALLLMPGTICVSAEASHEADICIYGGTSGGITAAIQAAREGRTVVLIEPTMFLGGLTTGGLGATDIGNKRAIGGVSREFYAAIFKYYSDESKWTHQTRADYFAHRPHGNATDEGTMWTFEPHVATTVYDQMLKAAGEKVTVVFGERLDLKNGVVKDGARIVKIVMESGREFTGKVFIDATYEGDLMAKAGVSYHVGREANATYGETLNGVQVGNAKHHQFIKNVDPYVTKGDPKSGLLPGIEKDIPGPDGAGDRKVQAYNFRMCTTDSPANRRDWEKPVNYDERRYELALRNVEAGENRISWAPTPMPNRKTDTNNNFAISTDFIGQNWDYTEADYATRAKIWRAHEDWQKGLMWTYAYHPRVPEKMRLAFQRFGLAKDEFNDNGNWPRQLYVREARRMVSDYVMSEKNCRRTEVIDDSVGMGAYNMDSHHIQRYVTKEGYVRNEGDVQVGSKPYPISFRSLRPKASECTNLLVPVCLSASHIAYGSIRMEPVFMVLGQSTATAAGLAIERGTSVQTVDYGALQERLLASGQVLDFVPTSSAGSSQGIPKAKFAGVVIDDEAVLKGFDQTGNTTPGYVGDVYRHDGDDEKGAMSARFTPDLPQSGTYRVAISYNVNSNRATNVPVTIRHAKGETKILVNQQLQPNGNVPFHDIGTFDFAAGKEGSVEITNADTNGHVIVDAVQWLPLSLTSGDLQADESATAMASTFFEKLNSGDKCSVVVYGTSLTHGGAWAASMKEWFDKKSPGKVTFYNGAGPGQNSDWGVANLKANVLNHHPDLVLIEFSYNDAHEKFKLSVSKAQSNLDQMVRSIRKQNPHACIVLQIMNANWDASNGKGSSLNRPELAAYNQSYRDYAQANHLPLLDHYVAWQKLKETDVEKFRRYIPDGTHPNKEGSLAITWPLIRDWLNNSGHPPATQP